MASSRPHALCIPFPAQGHIIPMLDLAKLLHARGFHVTYVNNHYNHRRLLRSRGAAALDGAPGFRFASIPDGLPSSDADVTQDVVELIRTKSSCLPHVKKLIDELNASGEVPPVTCVVADAVMNFVLELPPAYRLPVALFWTASTCSLMGYFAFKNLIERGLIPLKNAEQLTNGYLDTPADELPGLKNVRLRDLPTFLRTTDPDDFMLTRAIEETQVLLTGDALILNTVYELESTAVDALSARAAARVYTLGPLSLLAGELPPSPVNSIELSLWMEDAGCLRWLDGKPPGSVVYVNYGSITVMSKKEMEEFAWGLAGSGYDFLWIIRPDLVHGDDSMLPPEWSDETAGRSMLASWCSQRAVLEHASVGAFLTHSGWNSTIESLCAGVPMLCWPFFGDQQTNCRYACAEWGVGVDIGSSVERAAVEEAIREVMNGENGAATRAAAAAWKGIARKAVTAGEGLSAVNVDRLVNDVLLAPKL